MGAEPPIPVGTQRVIDLGNFSAQVMVPDEYRLAPEHPYPVVVNDSWDSLLWLHKNGAEELGIDPNRIALLGSSAGGNLAAVISQRSSLSSPRIPIKLQVLLVPVVDASHTAEDHSRWTQSMVEYETDFPLPVFDSLWLRDRYLPNPEDWKNPEASPIYQEDLAAFEGTPITLIVVAELDSLRNDGELYAQRLEKFGVPVTVKLVE
ncbi:hypothetical protein FRC11_000136, partial [Ceratobasidium sp. 423]